MADEEHDLVAEQSDTNPYHQKCFPPFCENASPVDKQGISKMNRDDLEDRYIVYADENLLLKKRIRDHERHIQRLQTALNRQDSLDKKGGAKIPASMHYDNARADNLESQNKHLEAKVKVLKQQLMNHSYIHSKENRLAENKEKQRRGERVSPDSFRDIAPTQSARRYKETSSPNRDTSALALKERVAMLEHQLKSQKEKYKERIIKLEQELAMLGKSDSSLTEQVSRQSKKVSDNVEMIRLRRISKEQAVHLAKLSDLNGASERELAELKEALRQATEHADELERQLQIERERSLEAQTSIMKVTSHSETIRALEEQVRDLMNERKTLKDTNEQLLQLTTGAHSKSDRSLQEQALRQQVSQLELKLQEKVRELEEKEEELIKMESLLQEAGRPHTPPTSKHSKSRDNLSHPSSKVKFVESAEKPVSVVLPKSHSVISPTNSEHLGVIIDQAERSVHSLSDRLHPVKENKSSAQERWKTAAKLALLSSRADEEKQEVVDKLESALREIEDLKRQRHDALQELEDLRRQLNLRSPVSTPKSLSRSSSKKDIGDEEESIHLVKSPTPSSSKKNIVVIEEPVHPLKSTSTAHSMRSTGTPKSSPSRASVSTAHSMKLAETPKSTPSCTSVSTTHSKKFADMPKSVSQLSSKEIVKVDEIVAPIQSSYALGGREELEKQLAVARVEIQELKRIAAEHEKCPRARSHSPATPVPSEHKITPVSSASEPRRVSTIHWVQEVEPEPAQKPLWVIVSKHEFDAVLLQKKKYFSQTEVAMPTDGKDMLKCRMDICIYDLEMDNRLIENLSNMERNPHVFVEWSFLGLDQRTVAMPASDAHFHTNVTYFGPLSGNMSDFVRQRDMPIYLMLEKHNGPAVKVGEGVLDLTPAINQPQRGFLRCVSLAGNHGSSIVYCSFKLHDCCQSEDIPVAETLEVSLGHLRLKPCDINKNPQATHLYFEYSLLGLCGPELETDSVPRSEVMNFNYTKRLRVHEDNANKLEPLLNRNNPKNLRFILLAEPCNLQCDTEVEEVGYAEINLVKEMVDKEKDIISAAVPVYSSAGQHIGSLSVTVLGISTIQNYTGTSSKKH